MEVVAIEWLLLQDPRAWRSVAAVLPVSERLRARVGGSAYEEAVERESAGLV